MDYAFFVNLFKTRNWGYIDFLDYIYAYNSVTNRDFNYKDLLEEYICDQKLEIIDKECKKSVHG